MKVLIVVDMQNDFVTDALGTAEAVAIVPAVVERVKEAQKTGERIFFTRDTHESAYLQTQEGQKLPVEHCLRGSKGWEIVPQLKALSEAPGVTVLDKPTFGSTELVERIGKYVEEYGEENVRVELIGLCTDICVVSNALLLKAHYHEMPLSLDPKCCAGVTPQKHDAAIETMRSCQIEIL